MYCSTCGAKNSASNNYCIIDGTKLKPYQGKYSLNISVSQYCSHCGNAVSAADNYCGSCGTTIHSYKKMSTKDVINPLIANVQKTRAIPKLNMKFFKPALFSSIAALLFVFMMSFVLFHMNKEATQSFLKKELNIDINETIKYAESATDTNLPEPDSLFGLTDMVMVSHFMAPVLKADINIDEPVSVNMKLFSGVMIFLLIPMLSLFVSGIIYQKITKEISPANLFYGSIAVGILYGLLLAIVSLFSGFDYGIKNKFLSINIHTSYSIFSALIKGFGFAFLFSFIGMLFSINFKKATGHLSQVHIYGEAIHQGISTFFRSMLAFSVISIIIFKMTTDRYINQIAELFGDAAAEKIINKSFQFALVIGTQIGLYIWNLASFGTLQFIKRSVNEESELSYSLFKGAEASGGFTHSDYLYNFQEIIDGSDFGFYTKLGILLLIILFIWSGYRISKNASNTLASIAIYGFVYSLLISLLIAITKFHFSASGNEFSLEVILGFSAIKGFIKNYLISFIFAYAGTFIGKWKS